MQPHQTHLLAIPLESQALPLPIRLLESASAAVHLMRRELRKGLWEDSPSHQTHSQARCCMKPHLIQLWEERLAQDPGEEAASGGSPQAPSLLWGEQAPETPWASLRLTRN